MRGERMSWITSFVLALGYVGRRAVIALPHEVIAPPGSTDALALRLFVAKSEPQISGREYLALGTHTWHTWTVKSTDIAVVVVSQLCTFKTKVGELTHGLVLLVGLVSYATPVGLTHRLTTSYQLVADVLAP